MKRSRFTETQVVGILKEAEARRKEIARESHRIPEFVFLSGAGLPFDDDEKRRRVCAATWRASRDAGLGRVGFHVLRHTAASWAVQAGRSLFEVLPVF